MQGFKTQRLLNTTVHFLIYAVGPSPGSREGKPSPAEKAMCQDQGRLYWASCEPLAMAAVQEGRGKMVMQPREETRPISR